MLKFIERMKVKPAVQIESKSQFSLTSGTVNERNSHSLNKSIFDVVQRDSKNLSIEDPNIDKTSDADTYITIDLSSLGESEAIEQLDRVVYKTKFSIYNGEIEESKCRGIRIIYGCGQGR